MATIVPSASGVDVSVNAGPARHYVDWGAILGGTFVAAAISAVFLAFGTAIGLSLTSFQSGSSIPAAGAVIAAGLWLLWVQVSGFMGGSYIAGRMRRRIGDATSHEVEMRDGAHGLFVWGLGVVAGVLLTGFLTLAGAAGLATVAGQAASNPNAVDYYVDRLLRTETTATSTTTGTGPATGGEQSQSQSQQIGRVLTRTLAGTELDDSDRAYLTREVSARTGLAQAEAEQRVNETVETLKAQADRARRYGIIWAFITATSLLLSAVGAWWAAGMGGKHRDENVDHSRLTRWR